MTINWKANGAWKLVATLLPLLIAGLVAWGQVHNEQVGLRRDLERKANQETMQVQYETLLRELQAINRRLERLETRSPR